MTTPAGFVDLHAHVYVGLDDGPGTLEEAMALCRALVADGVELVAGTCHQRGAFADLNADAIRQAAIALVDNLQREQIPLTVVPNAEWMLDSATAENLPELMPELLTIADRGKYALVEFPYQFPQYAEIIGERLRPQGLRLVLAHIERYPLLASNYHRVHELLELGFVTQVNADSLTGQCGPTLKSRARALLRRGLVHLIASDSHSAGQRPPCMKEAFTVVKRIAGIEAATLLFRENPFAVVQGEDVTLPKPAHWLSSMFWR